MKWIESYFFAPTTIARPYLVRNALLLLFAVDAFRNLLEHGKAYGIADFNVAQFSWLDAIQPTPTSAVYVGLLVASGLLAWCAVFTSAKRWAVGALAVIYTYSWMMSFLDTYQHHYLLSWVFAILVFFPGYRASQVTAVDDRTKPNWGSREVVPLALGTASAIAVAMGVHYLEFPDWAAVAAALATLAIAFFSVGVRRASIPQRRVWAYPLLSVSIAIVYLFTALSKTEPLWRSGDALMATAGEALGPALAFGVESLGFERQELIELLGASMVPLQLLIAAGYLAAPMAERSKVAKGICFLAWPAAMSFHVGAEYLGLRVGWFSWYMMLTATVFLLGDAPLYVVAKLVTLPFRWLSKTMNGSAEGGEARVVGGVGLLAALGFLCFAGVKIDLPGVVAGVMGGGLLAILAIYAPALRRDESSGLLFDPRSSALGLALSAGVLWGSVATSTVRFDFYRNQGSVYRRLAQDNVSLETNEDGVSRRLGYLERAADAYALANQYAPDGVNRDRQESEVSQELTRERQRLQASSGQPRPGRPPQ